MSPIDKAARIAGGLYLSIVLIGPFSLMYVPTKVIVHGNPMATANNIQTHETLFRLGIGGNLIGAVLFILVGLALYRLLKDVNAAHALQMVALVLVSGAVMFMNELNNIAALILVRGADFMTAIDKPQRDALTMLFLRLHGQGNVINELFWGLWLFPFGILVIKSRFLPRILGALLLVNGVAYVAMSLSELLVPNYADVVSRIAFPAQFGEVLIMLWMVVMGAKVRSPVVAAAAS